MGPNIHRQWPVTDAATGEYVLGANVLDVEEGKGVSTNNYGFYSITSPSALQNWVVPSSVTPPNPNASTEPRMWFGTSNSMPSRWKWMPLRS